MAGGGGISSDVSGIERLLVNFNIGGVRNCFSSSVTPEKNNEKGKISKPGGATTIRKQ